MPAQPIQRLVREWASPIAAWSLPVCKTALDLLCKWTARTGRDHVPPPTSVDAKTSRGQHEWIDGPPRHSASSGSGARTNQEQTIGQRESNLSRWEIVVDPKP